MTPMDWSTIALSLLLLSGLILWATWLSGCMARRVAGAAVDVAEAPRAPGSALTLTPFASALLPVDAAVQDVLAAQAAAAARRGVQLELAVQPDLAVRADPRVLQEVLGDLVSQAIRRAPCGQVLVGSMRHGGRVQISVSDDGIAMPREVQAAALRETSRLAALQGGTLDIETYPGQGSTVILRLPDPADSAASRTGAVTDSVVPHAVLGARIAVTAGPVGSA